jgi:O-antigen/teichoic acid export membrane protein
MDTVTRNVIINTVGNYISFFIGALYTIILFRFFSPYDFGVLSILLAISYLLANLLSFGIPATLYAHVPQLLPDKEKAYDFLKSNFLFQTGLASISLLGLYVILPRIDMMIFKLDLPPYYYALTLVSTLLYIWQNFVRDSINAAEKFFQINAANTVANVIRIVLIIIFGYLGMLTIPLTLCILGIIAPAIVFIGVLPQRKKVITSLFQHKINREHIKLRFTMPYFVSTQLFNLTTRADLFLIAYYLTTVDAGHYSVAQRVIFVIITSIDSITQVLSAEFSKVTLKKDVVHLIKKAFYYMAIPSIILLILAIAPSALYQLFIPHAYAPSIPLIKALSLNYIPFSFDAALLLFFLYTLKKPMYVLYINAIMLLLVTIFHLVFIPRMGIMGPVASFGLTYLIITGIIAMGVMRELRLLKH